MLAGGCAGLFHSMPQAAPPSGASATDVPSDGGPPLQPNVGEQGLLFNLEPNPIDTCSELTPATLADEASAAWGIAGLRLFPTGEQVAPNGLHFKPLFAADLDFNMWVWQTRGIYLFADATFWGQRAAPGITNPRQGGFDFSKREFDLLTGFAWNYWGPLEARAFAYSYNNLNRGTSETKPDGYADGVGLEQRWYLTKEYAALGTTEFDVARAAFVSAGYYPTKELIDADGNAYKPGPFIRAYLTADLSEPRCYLYVDGQLIGDRGFRPEALKADFGIATRPFRERPRVEFRVGGQGLFDPHSGELAKGLYGQFRYLY